MAGEKGRERRVGMELTAEDRQDGMMGRNQSWTDADRLFSVFSRPRK